MKDISILSVIYLINGYILHQTFEFYLAESEKKLLSKKPFNEK